MSTQLTVHAGDAGISWQVDDWTALIGLASLSADPETLAEFFAAARRYRPHHCWDESGRPVADIESAVAEDGDWCLIDLPSRSVIAGGEFELPDRVAAFQADESDDLEGGFHVLWLDTPADWRFQPASDDWQAVLAERRRSLVRRRRLDTRQILLGRPLLEFITDHVVADARSEVSDQQRYERIRALHAEWMMTPRADLLGDSPRHVLLSGREQIRQDIQHRAEQWSRQGFAPPALAVDSAAYRFGGYGTIEVVLYFDLLRSLLGHAWGYVVDGDSDCELLIERLANHREHLLNQPPDEESTDATCRELIDLERRRMPIIDDGGHADCDCPICQAQADGAFGPGPTFMFFDGHHLELEDEFAFSLLESREEWELEQAAFASYSEQLDREQLDRELAKKPVSGGGPEPIWKSSSVDWDKLLGNCSLEVAKVALGFPLSELVTNLHEHGADQATVDGLNTAYAIFRRGADPIAELSAAIGLRQSLEEVAGAHPELVAQSADLQSRLDEVLRLLDSQVQ